MDDTEDVRERYKQACEDFRFYADMRFKQLTLFSVVTGLLLNVATSDKTQQVFSPLNNKTTIGVAGMAFTAVLWIMEVRSTSYGRKFRTVKEKLEGVRVSVPGILSATNAVLVLYVASYLFWLLIWIDAGPRSSCGRLGELALALVGMSCLAYAIVEYETTRRSATHENGASNRSRHEK